MASSNQRSEVNSGTRFEFGRNWKHFLATLNEDKINTSVVGLQSMLGCKDLVGQSFLDVGSGSGLSSLAARRLGAKVHSFDYDPDSVACTRFLRDKYFPNDVNWTIDEASAIDVNYVSRLDKFDIVYSWGVLHHTGAMWTGLENVLVPLKDSGQLFVAIYNHQSNLTNCYSIMKRAYVLAPIIGKWMIVAGYVTAQTSLRICKDLVLFRNPFRRYQSTCRDRGMNYWHDTIDWIGGYPFEAARPDEIFEFYSKRNLVLEKMITKGGHGCNEFVFCKHPKLMGSRKRVDKNNFACAEL
jgi:2-polyprenyl-3-methyl-5-hydroxy-6-metoxy-1,4-benzoquinol methylase